MLRVLKVLFGLAGCAVLGLALLVGLLWLDHRRETTLPKPSGPFAVGRTTFAWTDPAHAELLAPQPGTKRELLAWVWYPAASGTSAPTYEDYMPAPWLKAFEGNILIKLFTRDLSRVHAHSIRGAEVSPEQRSYPVVLMRAGLAALTTNYTVLAEDLASHGYVVVGFDAPYRSYVVVLPNGTVIARAPGNNADLLGGAEQKRLAEKLLMAWTADMGFAFDQLEQLNKSDPSGRFQGRLDMQRAGVFGHSLGGAEALQFCRDDPRCKVGIDVDGAPLGSVIRDGVTQPFMFLIGDHRSEPDAESRPVLANIQSIYDRIPGDHRLWVTIRGANHYMFSDGAILRSPLLMSVLRRLGVVHLDGGRQIAMTAHYLDSFFDVYLKGAPASRLRRPAQYPEVEYAP